MYQCDRKGVLVPEAILSDWYIKLALYLPATYGAEGYYTIVFGGSSASIKNNILALMIIIGTTLLLSLGAVAAKRQWNTQPLVIYHGKGTG